MPADKKYLIKYKDAKFTSYVMKYNIVNDKIVGFSFTPHKNLALVYASVASANMIITSIKGKSNRARDLISEELV